jgi:type IV secretory pathway VirB10-like protein
MYIVLLALGVIVAIAGGGMIVYGIVISPFDFANTMVSAGMTGLVGGLVVIALASLGRELRATPRQPEVRKPPRSATSASGREAPTEKPSQAPASPADLSQVLAEPPAEPAPAEPRVEPTPPAPPMPAPPPGDPFAPARADPQRRAATRERSFDSVWAPEPAKPAPATARPAPEPAPARENESVAIRPTREAQAVSVLKSGVIEGMAYTLYSDGSIEADLPQGMMRFPSIDALRRHLAGQG